MQHRNPSKLSPGANAPRPAPAAPAVGASPPPGRGLRATVAFEQQGVPDAGPRAAVVGRPPPVPAAGGVGATSGLPRVAKQDPALTKTLAYDAGAFEDPGARKTLGYEQGDFVAPSPSAPPPAAALIEPRAVAPAALPMAVPGAPQVAAPVASPPGTAANAALGSAETVGVAAAGFQPAAPPAVATMPVGATTMLAGAATIAADAAAVSGDAATWVMGDTAAALGGAQASSGEPAGSAPSVGARSTILPHVEMAGQDLRLTHLARLRYEPTGPLGEGGVGFVEKANDNDIGRPVAVKRLHPHQQGPAVVVRFVDEIRTIGQLEHPNIVPIHDVGLDAQGEYYFVMKFVDGETLETIIDRLASGDAQAHRSYPFERRVEIFRDILEAIRFAHSQGIIHRDIKPANVMVGRYGEVVVMDWGLAKRVAEPAAGAVEMARAATVGVTAPTPPGTGSGAADGSAGTGTAAVTTPRGLSRPAIGAGSAMALQTQLGAVLGTPAYMSPEQARGEVLDVRSDVYSLCLMLHEFLCLRHPLADKQTLQQVIEGVIHEPIPMTGRVRSPHQSPTPMDLSWFVRKGVHKDPAKRYQTVGEMIDRLQLRSQGIIPIQCHLTFTKRVTNIAIRLSERFPFLFTVAMLVGVAVVIAAIVRLFE